jgi:hypothetical protein
VIAAVLVTAQSQSNSGGRTQSTLSPD